MARPSWLWNANQAAADGNVTVTPGTLALVLTTFAAVVSVTANVVVTPAPATLTLTRFAPTVTASDHKTVTPTTATLSLTRFAPTVTVSDNKTVTPTTASLVTNRFAPTVSVSDNKRVVPTTASLVTAKFAPTITVSNHKVVTPTTATLVTSAFAPTVTGAAGLTVTPGTAALVITTFAPDVTATTITPDIEEDTHDGVGGSGKRRIGTGGALIHYKRSHKKVCDEIEEYFAQLGVEPTEEEVAEVCEEVIEIVPNLEARAAVTRAIHEQVKAMIRHEESMKEEIRTLLAEMDDEDGAAAAMMELLH